MLQGNQNVIYSQRVGAYLLVGRGFLPATQSYLLGNAIKFLYQIEVNGNFVILIKAL